MKRMNNSRESFIQVKSKYKILNLKNRLSQIGLNDYWVFSFAILEPFMKCPQLLSIQKLLNQ